MPKNLLEYGQIKGCLHNHSTYSDGANTIEEMALQCQKLGLEYFGIADHSKTASYANGLTEERVLQQWEEIDRLNKKLAPFKILKGIESDILADGSLDYDADILSGFDYVVASVHSGLGMDIDTATTRLLAAIANPFTTILGHPTGRLILKRKGYPLDWAKIFAACAAHGVVAEINASPWRLDVDWRLIPDGLSKGVLFSINPDAHEIAAIDEMRFGTMIARKGALTAASTFNALSLSEMESYLLARKQALAPTLKS